MQINTVINTILQNFCFLKFLPFHKNIFVWRSHHQIASSIYAVQVIWNCRMDSNRPLWEAFWVGFKFSTWWFNSSSRISPWRSLRDSDRGEVLLYSAVSGSMWTGMSVIKHMNVLPVWHLLVKSRTFVEVFYDFLL